MTAKEKLIERCKELEISFQENDTAAQLELMIAGKESVEKIAVLNEQIEQLTAAYEELTKVNQKQANLSKIGGKVNAIEVDGDIYRAVGKGITMVNAEGKRVFVDANKLEEHEAEVKQLIEQGSGFLVKVESEKE